MAWLLYRYILFDLLRIIGLTTTILVTVIAFGATLKPLAGDSLLEPLQVVKYLGLAIVPMLQFALPFAAGFGATLCLHRMSSDNEIQAMAVSGISYRRIITPIIALGLGLMLFMVILTQSIIPRFWSAIEQMVAMDMTKAFQSYIKRGEPFQIGNVQIYAEQIYTTENPEGPDGPQTRMTLFKVAAAKLNEGRVVTDVTSNQAVVDVYRRQGRTYLKFVMADAMAFNGETGDLGYSDRVVPTQPLVMSSDLKKNPKALTRSQLLALRENPDDYVQVMEAKDALAAAMRDTEARNAIDDQLRKNSRVVLVSEPINDAGERRSYVITANRLRDTQFTYLENDPIEIVQFEGSNAVRKFIAKRAELMPAGGLETGSTFDLMLGEHEVQDLRRGGSGNQRAQLTIPNLAVEADSTVSFSDLSSRELIDRAQTMHGGPERLREKTHKLVNEIDSLRREITSRLLARYALSATAFLLLLLGATLAMWQRGSLPLTIYVWAFVPSIVDLILISAGEQVLRDGRLLGYFTMWSGNLIMLIAIGLVYRRLSRH